MKHYLFLLTVCIFSLAFTTQAKADGIIIPQPPPCEPCFIAPCPPPCPPISSPMTQLQIRYHRVTVNIKDQVAITHVDQVFFNPNSWALEGTYMFPMPRGAAVTSFTLWIDGKPVEGQVMDAKQARQQYWEIVNRLRDPALLEYINQGAVQAHIFPIPSQGERRIELEYSQALIAENGLVRYTYPLNTEKFSSAPLEQVSISADIQSNTPIRAVYSPSHTIDTARESPHHVTASYEANDIKPDSDFVLYYSIGETPAFHLLTFHEAGKDNPSGAALADSDGYFLLLLAPQPEVAQSPISKDIILVLDRSGSMDGGKFHQAQEALRFILRHLNPDDRFNMIAFSSTIDRFASEMQPVSQSEEGLKWVDRLNAQGSTDINRALLEASSFVEEGRPTYMIFLTDGLPTEGETNSEKILANLATATPKNLSIFPFGVGYDVDTQLLDSLAQAHHGASTYVIPGEDLNEVLSTFYEKISTPVLSNLALDFGELSAYDLYPNPLPDLFSGSQIVLAGRYRQGGVVDISLSGDVNGERQKFYLPEAIFPQISETFTTTEENSAIARLWATRKIGALLSQVRLKGADQETIDQIVHLSIRYGIVTPYTSYLVTEPMPLGAEQQHRIASDQFNQLMTAPPEASSGQGAVQKAIVQGSMTEAQAPVPQDSATSSQIRNIGSRTFVLSDGKWVDTAYDPADKTIQVIFLSPDYKALIESHPDLAAAFALGERVIAISNGLAYEVIAANNQLLPTDLPPTDQPKIANPTPASPLLIQSTPAIPPTIVPVPTRPANATTNESRCIAGLVAILLVPMTLIMVGKGYSQE